VISIEVETASNVRLLGDQATSRVRVVVNVDLHGGERLRIDDIKSRECVRRTIRR
jgi:hypothetical protein